MDQDSKDNISLVINYHQSTKHYFDRYARSPGGLDWANQPDPFRRYEGAELIPLDHLPPGVKPLYEPVFVEGNIPPEPLKRKTISQLFYDSLALSAWKQAGGVKWALRVNPSSGNLHPTEGYLICGSIPEVCDQPMVCHYAPKEHALEKRTEFSNDLWEELSGSFPNGSVLIGLTSIFWREAWKYGERAFRYCQHDLGHAIATVSLAAAGLGWKAILLDHLSTIELETLLGISAPKGTEPEHTECLLVIYPQGKKNPTFTISEETLVKFKTLTWAGKPNCLSPSHVDWPIIDQTADASIKPQTPQVSPPIPERKILEAGTTPISFRKILHQRRSCLSLNGQTGMVDEGLYQIFRKTLVGPAQFPFNTLPWDPKIHLAIFIHRVENLNPGLYFLVRNPSQLEEIKNAMNKEFLWEKPASCPGDLDFFRLLVGDAKRVSEQISCHQGIAADGCFSLGMIAEFDVPLNTYGAWFYPRLFWEAGLVGQMLYLEAEAFCLRGTGIGCFFDDPMHELLGLSDLKYQSIYHFTLGGNVNDPRLTTLPPYSEIKQPSP
ncbi:MAG TPA: SagB/ThcOx family dehydrogenase [Nitrospiria bacterium]|jgi:SagB-type dehydrogenase family enzyme